MTKLQLLAAAAALRDAAGRGQSIVHGFGVNCVDRPAEALLAGAVVAELLRGLADAADAVADAMPLDPELRP